MLGFLLIAGLLAPPAMPEARDKVIKVIKEAERGAYEAHRLPTYLAAFADDAVWTRGRRATPEAHDVVLDRKVMEALLRLELAPPPSPTDKLYFDEPTVDLAANPPTLQIRIARMSFGRKDVSEAKYTLRAHGGTWKIAAVRTWPLYENVAMSQLQFDEPYWARADAWADRTATDGLEDVVDSLRLARRFGQLHDLMVRFTAHPKTTAAEWIMRAEAALWNGRLTDAQASVQRALKLDPRVAVPPLLRRP